LEESVKVFTIIDSTMVDQAVVWATSFKRRTSVGNAFIFHTPDVDTSRFYDMGVNLIRVDAGRNMRKYPLLTVLDMMVKRNFGDKVLYVAPYSLFTGSLEHLTTCPLSIDTWLCARATHAYHGDKRNGSFYRTRDPLYAYYKSIASDGYFNTDVLYLKLGGVVKALKAKGVSGFLGYLAIHGEGYRFPESDTLNSICGDRLSLKKRYNMFAENTLRLDFGDVVKARRDMSNASIVTYGKGFKPWDEPSELGTPTTLSSQYAVVQYANALKGISTYLSTSFRTAVATQQKIHELIDVWDTEIRPSVVGLRRKLVEFRAEIDPTGVERDRLTSKRHNEMNRAHMDNM